MFVGMCISLFIACVIAGFIVAYRADLKASHVRDPWVEHHTMYVPVRRDGHEVFTPEPLQSGLVYEVSVIGFFHGEGYSADGVYRTDSSGNFTERHKSLLIGGYAVSCTKPEGWREDRSSHRYSFLMDGKGERVAVQILRQGVGEALLVTFTPMPAGTLLVAKRRKVWGTTLEVPACAAEIRSEVLTRGAVYRLHFHGTYGNEYRHLADAAYYAEQPPHFTRAYAGFTVNGKSVRQLDSWRENRTDHEYSCLVLGEGRLAARPQPHRRAEPKPNLAKRHG